MQILLIFALVLSIALAENVPSQPVSDLGLRLSLSLAAMLLAPLFAFATSSIVIGSLRRNEVCTALVQRKFARLRNIHSLLWLALAVVTLWQLGWVQIVRFNWSLASVALVDDVLILFPLLGSLILSWAAFYDADRGIDFSSTTISASKPEYASRAEYLALHTRHNLLLLLVPVLGVFAVQDLVRWCRPQISEDVQVGTLLLLVIAIALFFPVVLRHIWSTAPLSTGPLKERLTEQSRRSGFKITKFFVWQTNRMMVNAAVAGLIRPWRYVFFTDALVERFTEEEVEAVLAHEIGHVRRHHVLDRLLALLLPVLMWNVLANLFPSLPQAIQNGLQDWGVGAPWQATLLSPLLLIVYAATVFAAHARLLEHEADLFAVHALCPDTCDPEIGCRRVVAVLEKLARVGGIKLEKRSWLHPAICERINFLHQVADHPSIGRRFEIRMRLRRAVMGGGFVVLLLCLAVASA